MSTPIPKAERQILQGHEAGHKAYLVNEEYAPRTPAEFWFQRSSEGEILFVVCYIGLSGEGLALLCGLFIRPGKEPLVALLERFNQTQDFSLLEQVIGES